MSFYIWLTQQLSRLFQVSEGTWKLFQCAFSFAYMQITGFEKTECSAIHPVTSACIGNFGSLIRTVTTGMPPDAHSKAQAWKSPVQTSIRHEHQLRWHALSLYRAYPISAKCQERLVLALMLQSALNLEALAVLPTMYDLQHFRNKLVHHKQQTHFFPSFYAQQSFYRYVCSNTITSNLKALLPTTENRRETEGAGNKPTGGTDSQAYRKFLSITNAIAGICSRERQK